MLDDRLIVDGGSRYFPEAQLCEVLHVALIIGLNGVAANRNPFYNPAFMNIDSHDYALG